jgi:peptidoglycan/xylan/chitin deacetylase (PgdA/CDA1 family)
MNLKLLIMVLVMCLSVSAQTNKPSRRMTFTFDDLPYVAIEQEGLPTARRATKEILRVLRAHRVPVVGFVNEGQLQVAGEVDERIALLQQWVDAGMILANHTFSHADLNTCTIQEFQDEIIKGEVVTRRLMQSHQPYQLYFRYPQTHTGDTQAKKEAIEGFLAARGYKVTPHTVDGEDFVFNVGYLRALSTKDEAKAKRLREAYLDFSIVATSFAEHISPQIFGREVPQTLLIHANMINADCLDELLLSKEEEAVLFQIAPFVDPTGQLVRKEGCEPEQITITLLPSPMDCLSTVSRPLKRAPKLFRRPPTQIYPIYEATFEVKRY